LVAFPGIIVWSDRCTVHGHQRLWHRGCVRHATWRGCGAVAVRGGTTTGGFVSKGARFVHRRVLFAVTWLDWFFHVWAEACLFDTTHTPHTHVAEYTCGSSVAFARPSENMFTPSHTHLADEGAVLAWSLLLSGIVTAWTQAGPTTSPEIATGVTSPPGERRRPQTLPHYPGTHVILVLCMHSPLQPAPLPCASSTFWTLWSSPGRRVLRASCQHWCARMPLAHSIGV
jgi:hypothetical protein